MEDFVKAHGSQMMAWTDYIRLMRVFGDTTEQAIRGLFKRGVQVVKDNRAGLAELWLEWEKRFANVQSLDQCVKFLKKNNLYHLLYTNAPQQSYHHQKEEREADQKKGKKQKQVTKRNEKEEEENDDSVLKKKRQRDKGDDENG